MLSDVWIILVLQQQLIVIYLSISSLCVTYQTITADYIDRICTLLYLTNPKLWYLYSWWRLLRGVQVHYLAPRWSDICCALNLPHEETIRKETQGDDIARCFRMVLRKWLQKSYNYQRWGCPTWRMLVEAVGDPAGGNNLALAETIAKKHLGMYSKTNCLTL